ncbi:aminodeoxychorismate lyase [Ferrimonas balearica]|uniref:aminodeoxychorismate lyase n=1 Tax=Ferrimonas balearica TaxID=44012 RepID=UPI001C9A1C80|nr:aminodeoxychorismate lyase [Ferrimonas balearica]MBY5991561.1 aminodeoxychorismate lyase [Ferrimonas balearica]
MKFWLDGEPTEALPADDRGLALGDGHFTTMLVKQGRVVLWSLHQARLAKANARMGLTDPDWALLAQEIEAVASDQELAVLRLTLTRGSSGRGYQGQWGAQPRRLMTLSEFPHHYRQWQTQGIAAAVAHTRLATGGPLAGLKTLGRLEQVLLKREAEQRGLDELLVCDAQGNLVEATAGNLFLVTEQGVWTPALNRCGVAGVMRERVMATLTEMGHPVRETDIPRSTLKQVREAFVTNALMGVVPLSRIDDIELPRRSVADALLETLDLWR